MSGFLKKLPANDAELIRVAIAASELSIVRFAERVTWRDERTIRRWLSGEPMPQTARERLRWFLGLSQTQRMRLLLLVQVEPKT